MGLFGKLFGTRDIKKNECLVCGELIDLEFKTCYTCKKEDKKQLNATINTKKIYKRDMDGLVSFFKDFPHSHKLYNELSSLAFESRTVKQYLNEANILINDQLKNEAEQGLNDVADFLYEILKTQKNSVLRKNYLTIIEALKIISTYKVNVNDYSKSSNDKVNSGDYIGAIQDLDKAILLDSENAVLFYNRGSTKKMNLQFRDAILDLEKAIQLKTGEIEINEKKYFLELGDAYFNLAMSKFHNKDNEGASIELKKAEKNNYKDKIQIQAAFTYIEMAQEVGYDRALELSEMFSKRMYKKDFTGLTAYFNDTNNAERLYNEFTWAIRNNSTVENYLTEANLLVDDQTKNASAEIFSHISFFLYEILKTNENIEMRKDYNACKEAIKLLTMD